MRIKKDISNIEIYITEKQIRYLESINADPPISDFDLRAMLRFTNIRDMKVQIENWLKTNLFLQNLWRMLKKMDHAVKQDILTAPQTKAAVLLEMGYTCREVNEKLGLPVGTVLKWVQNPDESESPLLKMVDLKVTDMSKNIETRKKERPVLTAADIKKKVNTQVKNHIAFSIGAGQSIGDVIQEYIYSLNYNYDFDENLTQENITALLREAFRTCNPNDKKFNAKKYGDAYKEGRLSMVQEMGNDLMNTVRTYIQTLNRNLTMPLFDIQEKITIKEYAALGKDLAAAVSLYQSIAQTHQPNAEEPFDVLPALDRESSLTEIDAAKAALPAPSDTQKALPDTSKRKSIDT